MKKLLFNGCSFVAGDAIVWEEYLKLNNIPVEDYFIWMPNSNKQNVEQRQALYTNYRDVYRRTRNIPAIVAKHFNTEVLDLSEDGNSNDAIAMTTILKLLEIPVEKRKEFHVVIGWTESSRRARYLTSENDFFNLHVRHWDQKDTSPYVKELVGYLTHGIVLATNRDHYLNYVRSIMLLENFLKANGVTYTFYRSLGTPSDCTPHNLDCFFFGQSKLERDTDKKTFTNDNNWYKFNNNTTFLGFEGSSVVHEYMQDGLTFRVHPRNGHPNTILATKIAFDLAEFITNQGDL
jgi:hypothetical protein